jgi:hypothetical protein
VALPVPLVAGDQLTAHWRSQWHTEMNTEMNMKMKP